MIDFQTSDEHPHGDTAHIYSGGWGNTGTNVDAGLMHNPGKKNWSLFIRVSGGGDYADPLRLKPGQNAYLRFKVVSDDQVAVYVNAVDVNGNNVERTYQLAASGWTVSGSGNIIKRLTTIAQNEEAGESFSTGALIANSRWYSSKIGTSSTNNHTWATTDTGGYCSYPSDKITVNWVSPAEETVKIDLK